MTRVYPIQLSGSGTHLLAPGIPGKRIKVLVLDFETHNADTYWSLVGVAEGKAEVIYGDRTAAKGSKTEEFDMAETGLGYGLAIVVANPAAALGGSVRVLYTED